MSAIEWGAGTDGPWVIVETPDYAEIRSANNTSPVALVGISTADARAIAEVPAMVHFIRQIEAGYRNKAVGSVEREVSSIARAILARVDGSGHADQT
jgi:hypothetical protein